MPAEIAVACPRCGHLMRPIAPQRLGLTKKAHELKMFLIAHIGVHGESPSYAQMALAIGIRSKSGIVRLVRELEERGHVSFAPGRARSIAVLP
jgi:repressor LexA